MTPPKPVVRGLPSLVAAAVGCSKRYAWLVLSERIQSDTVMTRRIKKRAAELLAEIKIPA